LSDHIASQIDAGRHSEVFRNQQVRSRRYCAPITPLWATFPLEESAEKCNHKSIIFQKYISAGDIPCAQEFC